MGQNSSRPTLRIYIAKHCQSCAEALRLASEVKVHFTGVNVELIDLDDEASVNADNVFSIPTYVLDGRILSLGNPAPAHLFSRLMNAVS